MFLTTLVAKQIHQRRYHQINGKIYRQHFVCFFLRLIFQQTFDNPIGTSCALLLIDFVYSQTQPYQRQKGKQMSIVKSLGFTFRYINDIMSLNNCFS